MKRILVIILSALLPMFSMGQSSLGKTDDLGRIAIAAVVPDEAGIPAGAQRMLQSRLTQVATLNGLGAAEGSQFAMLPMVSIISKDVTPTAPPMISLNMEITLYIVDAKSQAIFSQTSIPLKGVGNTEDRAYTQAINNINPRHGQFRGFVEKGKEKIVEYYNSQCDVIISSAKALAGQKKYDEALATLFNVPDVSRECYDKCMNISVDIYQEYSNQQCNVYLSAAKAAWAGKELSKVEENLGKITPDMSCYDEAQQLVATVSTAVEAEGGSAWNFKMKKYDDSVDIQKMKIQAGKEVAQSWAYHGAAAHFDWSWMYPGSEKKVVEQPKTEPQSEPQKVTEQATTTPSSEKKPPIGERPKASDLVVPIFKDGKPTFNDKIGFEEYPIITSNTSIKTIAGVIQRQFCIAPEGFSPLEIVRFYQSFIESKGGKMIYQAREANTFKIDGKHPSAYLNTHAISRTSNYEYMRASCNEYFVGVIYTDKTDLYLVVGAGRADGKPVYHLVTVEVAQ